MEIIENDALIFLLNPVYLSEGKVFTTNYLIHLAQFVCALREVLY